MYKLTHRIYNKFKLAGFRVKDENGNVSIKKLSEVMDLLRSGQVEDFKVITEDDKEYIVGLKNTLYSLPIDTVNGTLNIKQRMLNSEGKVEGYIVYGDDPEKELKVSKEKMWELAFYKKVVGIKAYLNENSNGEKERILISK